MGTNYYWHERPPCPCCGREYEPLHIGKSSVGWCFSLHVIPEKNINDLGDWEHLWRLGGHIEDEYGKTLSIEEMQDRIINRSAPGPHGLARHIVDGWNCTGHGEGTWDLIIGEFS